jgi:hypothetical protein
MKAIWVVPVVAASALGVATSTPLGAAAPAADLEFFEQQVRPVLAENCYACHSAKAPALFANLRLDSRQAVLRGGDAGPVVRPGDPAASKLVRLLHGDGPQMPPTGKLAPEKIAALERWVEIGLPWPEEAAPAGPDPSAPFDLEARRAEHWAWQPVRRPAVPQPRQTGWARNAVDRFLLARLENERLAPAEDAARRVFIRRVTFDLTGLPPTTDEIAAYLADQEPGADERLIDRLLDSPHFGERQARLWMDLMRYSESHGSEGDPDIRNAWQYRDYLIRAFNADLPYDQLVREHLAGDLLAKPRIDPELGVNESILGTAHWRLVEHGFQPVDPWDDRVKWTDNQVDVLSKTFLGLTVSCARCHDHKFDAISQADYFAMFGTIKGARPTMRPIDAPDRLHRHEERLSELKARIRESLGEVWSEVAAKLAVMLEADAAPALTEAALEDPTHPLQPWAVLRHLDGNAFQQTWASLAVSRRAAMQARKRYNDEHFEVRWDLRKAEDLARWIGHGVGYPAKPAAAGEIDIASEGARVIGGVLQAGAYTHRLSAKHGAVLQSPRFVIDSDYISFESAGEGWSNVQLIIENYPAPRGGIYHLRHRPKSRQMRWSTWKTDYWKGFTAYLEAATYEEITLHLSDAEDNRDKVKLTSPTDGRSWIGLGAVAFHNEERTPRSLIDPLEPLFRGPAPADRSELARLYERVVVDAVDAWNDGAVTEAQAALLDVGVRDGLLPNRAADLQPLVKQYRELEADIPRPRYAPAVVEEGGDDQPLLLRGDPKRPGDPVPRRFLSALGGDACPDPRLARLHLADRIVSARNPLTARVAVNRLWRQLFGDGLVRTEENFGKLGEEPSHPELLDFLAHRFVEDGWSIKRSLRLLAGSRAYRMASGASVEARERDPENRLLSHMPIRRLEAEQIRDAILLTSGELDRRLFGASIPVYYAYETGKTKGDNPKGPLDGKGRRSVYQEIRRNTHNPFLEVFDAPPPATARPHRDATNVPAQALTMLNSPFVIEQAERWAARMEASPESAAQRVERMFEQALGRPATAAEKDRALGYVAAAERPWSDLAHSLLNLKEFLYLR